MPPTKKRLSNGGLRGHGEDLAVVRVLDHDASRPGALKKMPGFSFGVRVRASFRPASSTCSAYCWTLRSMASCTSRPGIGSTVSSSCTTRLLASTSYFT